MNIIDFYIVYHSHGKIEPYRLIVHNKANICGKMRWQNWKIECIKNDIHICCVNKMLNDLAFIVLFCSEVNMQVTCWGYLQELNDQRTH